MSSRRVLSYGDILLRERDVQTLRPRCWLNDSILEFFLSYLAEEVLSEDDRKNVVLVGPSVTFWLRLCQGDDLKGSLRPLLLSSRKVLPERSIMGAGILSCIAVGILTG